MYCGQFSQDTKLQSCINFTGGAARGQRPTMPATLQVLTQGPSLAPAMARAMQLYNALYPPPNRLPCRMVTLSADWRAQAIDAIQPPYDLGIMANDQREVVFNIQLRRRG